MISPLDCGLWWLNGLHNYLLQKVLVDPTKRLSCLMLIMKAAYSIAVAGQPYTVDCTCLGLQGQLTFRGRQIGT